MTKLSHRKRRWGIVLAGGDGVRLRPLTRLVCGDDRPKQFCPLYDGRTLLDQTRRRVQRSMPAEQILFSLNRAHEEYYLPALEDCPSQRLVQPRNRGTVAAILSSLFWIAREDQNATIAVFPSDHYYSDENVIDEAVEKAFELSHQEPDSVVLLGAKPDAPEIEFGWIEVGAPVRHAHDSFRVRGFVEKPSPPVARFLLEQGSLWNTFVLVGKIIAFLEMTCSAMPGLLKAFEHLPAFRTPSGEVRIEDSLYAHIPSADFSRQVLSVEPHRLIVQRLGPVAWNDLGDCNRVVAAFSPGGKGPEWAKNWHAAKAATAIKRQASLTAVA
jgi:mannose-1-phosphate guanylyltransferase